LIGTAYGEQLRLKQRRVHEAFGCYASLAGVDVPPIIGSPRAFGYRNQAKLVARRARRGLLLGIYRPGSHQVIDIRRCAVQHPLINSVLDAVARTLERLDISTYDERSRTGTLRYVVVRVSNWTKRAQIILVTRERRLPRVRELVRTLRQVRGVASVVQNVNDTAGNVILG
jgi:23S rRNA (uracil1939-C5)-methyltransferase